MSYVRQRASYVTLLLLAFPGIFQDLQQICRLVYNPFLNINPQIV